MDDDDDDDDLYRRMQIINSIRCMTETSINPSSSYVLYNIRNGMLNTDFTISWYPKTLYTYRRRRRTTITASRRLRFYTTRAYLDNNIPLFYANLNKRNQC